jgi:nucleoside-diphosphate-sugar epimerase
MRGAKINVAVTGASGQLGTHLCRRLAYDRSIGKIVAIDRVPPAYTSAKLKYVKADVRDPTIGDHFEGCEVVIHLAFIVTSKLERTTFDDINIRGSVNVFESAVRAGAKQIIYASSVAAYGIAAGLEELLVETSPRRLVDSFPYSAAKYRVEEFLDGFETAHPAVAVVRFRPTILMGAHLNNPLGELFAKGMEAGFLIGASTSELPSVWDEDVADAFILAQKQRARGAYNLSADDPLSFGDLAKETGLRLIPMPKIGVRALPAISRLLPRGAVDPSWQQCVNVRVRPSSAKAKQELGWAPKYATGSAVMKAYLAAAHGRTDPRINAFMTLVGFGAKHAPADPETSGFDSTVHLAITGRGGADYTIRIKDQKLSFIRGVPRPPTSIVSLEVETFRELMSGRMTYATAQVTGRVVIEGDTSGAFVVPGMFARFRAETERKNLRGRAVRMVAKFLQGEAR